jgi:hypothetical protein
VYGAVFGNHREILFKHMKVKIRLQVSVEWLKPEMSLFAHSIPLPKEITHSGTEPRKLWEANIWQTSCLQEEVFCPGAEILSFLYQSLIGFQLSFLIIQLNLYPVLFLNKDSHNILIPSNFFYKERKPSEMNEICNCQ